MNKILFILVILTAHLSLEGRIAESINNVDLIIEDKLNEKGQNFGEDYYIHNNNDIPIRFSIKLVNAINAKDDLIKNTVIIEPLQRISVGSVSMDNPAQEASWSYELLVKPD